MTATCLLASEALVIEHAYLTLNVARGTIEEVQHSM